MHAINADRIPTMKDLTKAPSDLETSEALPPPVRVTLCLTESDGGLPYFGGLTNEEGGPVIKIRQ